MDKLKREWKSDMETYDKLINKEKELHEIMIKCMVERDKLFEDMDISEDTKYQKNLISLINNVMWERKISLK